MVVKTTPAAIPGRCRTSTKPATVGHSMTKAYREEATRRGPHRAIPSTVIGAYRQDLDAMLASIAYDLRQRLESHRLRVQQRAAENVGARHIGGTRITARPPLRSRRPLRLVIVPGLPPPRSEPPQRTVSQLEVALTLAHSTAERERAASQVILQAARRQVLLPLVAAPHQGAVVLLSRQGTVDRRRQKHRV
jgi:hypothetical protein